MRHGQGATTSAAVLTVAAASVGLVATLAVSLVPQLRFAYRVPALHIVLETVNALIALAVCYLLYGRFRTSRRLQDLLLAYALGVVAVANLVLTALPAALLFGSNRELTGWMPVVVRFFGTALLAAAALVGPMVTTRRPRLARNALLLAVAVLALASVGYALGQRLPPPVDPLLALDPARPLVEGHPLVLLAQGLGVLLYGVAAVAFARQASVIADELLRWVAPACALAALARVNYLLFPSLYTDFVYTGDLLRLAFYGLLLLGAAREVQSYWEAKATAAVLEDRRRLARDLHDGLTQELSYIYAQSQRLARGSSAADRGTVEQIGGAAARALDEARSAITALTRRTDEPFAVLLQRVVEDLGSRYAVRTVTRIDPTTQVSVEQGEALLRITGEAVRNAARHGAASTVEVRLDALPLGLLIRDDGTGFDCDAPVRPGAFGLTSMRERAAAVGARFRLESTQGSGTGVHVVWP